MSVKVLLLFVDSVHCSQNKKIERRKAPVVLGYMIKTHYTVIKQPNLLI